MWFDVSLYKAQGENLVKLDEVPVPVNITAKVPESLQKDGRTFYLLHAHDGKVTNAAEGAGDTLAWKTSEFSTYLLAYKDAESPSSGDTTDDATDNTANNETDKAVTKASSASAKTGDSLQLMVIALVVAAIASGAVGIALGLRRKRF